MAPWVRFLEAYLVQALLKSPTFHAGVRQVHKRVHQLRHGVPPEEMGGTKLDIPEPEGPGLLQHFIDEVRDQAGWSASKKNLPKPPPPPPKKP
ncbi:hypothetical protein MBLNU457_3219t1 [Dothideomycetes sp. NU457]